MTAATDRELIALAAKAAGVPVVDLFDTIGDNGGIEQAGWSPLTDDGDTLRLAVKLGIEIRYVGAKLRAIAFDEEGKVVSICEIGRSEGEKGARRVIVMCAAEIGRGLP